MKQLNNNSKFKRGGVSMFLVVIFGSLMALMVASYMRLVIRDQSQASNLDLSQSAYDSAQAGVEDAKVFLARFSNQCGNGLNTSDPDCIKMANQLNSDTCNSIQGDAKEVQVQTSAGDNALNQAYTCLKIRRNTPDFLGKVAPGSSKVVPLKGIDSFNRIRLHWNTREDMNGSNTVNLENTANPTLSTLADWNVNRPAVLKAQYFGYTNDPRLTLDHFDNNFSTNGTGLDEQIYYPVADKTPGASNSTGLPTTRRELDGTSTLKQVTPVVCKNEMIEAVYSCTVTVDLGHEVKQEHTAFVRLTPIYKAANFKVELLNNDTVVDFNGVQPIVDSTGRANDKFRRVESRIEFEDQNLPIPDFALQLHGDNPLCKNFYVTNKTNNIADATTCKTEASATAGS